MTTATTTTAISHAATANFRTWVAEIIAQLLAVGLTQTTDTGQINTATVNKPGTSTSAGYAIFKFNDTLQSTSPVFFKLEFGTGSATANPAIWVTIGTGSSGAGAINGVVGTRRGAFYDTNPLSTVTTYVSRFVYNATHGFFGMAWKIGSSSGPGYAMGGIMIGRSNDNTGAATGDAVWMVANSNSTSGLSGTGYMECISYLTSAVYPQSSGSPVLDANWFYMPFNDAGNTNLYAGNTQVGPCFYMTPVLAVSALAGMGMMGDIALGSTFSAALVGTTPLTFIQLQGPFGQSPYSGNAGMCMLWQ